MNISCNEVVNCHGNHILKDVDKKVINFNRQADRQTFFFTNTIKYKVTQNDLQYNADDSDYSSI